MAETIAFLGLGRMGRPMAANLVEAGFPVRVWNRTIEKAEGLPGATVASSPAEAVASGGIAVTMLADDRAVEEVVEGGLLDALGQGGIHLSMSTISPATARRLAALHAEKGSRYVGAPVFGRPDAAAARKLWIALSGDPASRARVRAVVEALGQGIFEFGDEPSSANLVKVAGNFLIASALEAMGEAYTLGEKNGIDPVALADFFGKTLFSCAVYQNYGRAIAEQRWTPPGFTLRLGLKDVGLVNAEARSSETPMPFAALLQHRLLTAVARGNGDLDWTAIARGVREDAGLESGGIVPSPQG